MDDKERQTMREHIVWLATELEKERKVSQQKSVLIKRILDPEDLGYAVSQEIRQLAYQLMINELHMERKAWEQNKED